METLKSDEIGEVQARRTGSQKRPSPASLLKLWKPWTLMKQGGEATNPAEQGSQNNQALHPSWNYGNSELWWNRGRCYQSSRTGQPKQPSPASLLKLWKPWTLMKQGERLPIQQIRQPKKKQALDPSWNYGNPELFLGNPASIKSSYFQEKQINTIIQEYRLIHKLWCSETLKTRKEGRFMSIQKHILAFIEKSRDIPI